MTWADQSRRVIAAVHANLPPDATYAERKAALLTAYPFGLRQYFPYKIWLREQRKYLEKFERKRRVADCNFGLFADDEARG